MALVDADQMKLLHKSKPTDLSALARYLNENEMHRVALAMSEYVFCPGRKWRFDLAVWPRRTKLGPVALEVQGGIFTRGRHTRGPALLKEWAKLNAAASLGWRIVYATPDQVKSGKAKEIIDACL